MKRVPFFLLVALSCFSGNAQVVLNIMSPSTIQGALAHTNNGNSNDPWGLPNLLNPSDAVLDTVVLMNDFSIGLSPTVGVNEFSGNSPYPAFPMSLEGCALDTTNSAHTSPLFGKIVIIVRGSCQFGNKVYLAQRAGARAVILVNHSNPQTPLAAAPGLMGGMATIPFAVVSRPDGDMLISAIQAGQTVVAFLGNKLGAFANDMSISPSEVLYPSALAVPKMIAQDSSDFKIKLGFWTRNDGSANQSNVVASATVKRGGTTLYTQSTASFALNSGDSSYITFPPFQLISYPLGSYEVNYNVNILNDLFPLDNNVKFSTSLNDSLFSYARVDTSTLKPIDNLSIKTGATFSSSWGTGIHFRHPQAHRMILKGVRFAAFADTLTGRSIDISVDKWDDVFVDLSDPNCDVVSLNPLAVETYTYSTNAQDSLVTHYFTDPIELTDNQRYIIALNTSDPDVYINHSSTVAYQLNDVTPGEQPRELIRVDNGWSVTGFSGGRIPTLQLILEQNFANLPEEVVVDALVYPNPAQHMVYLKLNGFVPTAGVSVYDLNGALVLQANHASVVDGELALDVSELPSGAYVVVAPGANRELRANLVVTH
jgi:hypothetical protein